MEPGDEARDGLHDTNMYETSPLTTVRLARATSLCSSAPFHQPCTVTEHYACWIVDRISLINVFLFHVKMELQEMPGQKGQLALVGVPDEWLFRESVSPEQYDQAVAAVYWLLKKHFCIRYLSIHPFLLLEHGSVLSNGLQHSPSIKSLKIDFNKSAATEALFASLCTLRNLESLECLAPGQHHREFPTTAAMLLRVCPYLTTLKISEFCMGDNNMATAFVAALKENLTLSELSVHASICEASRHKFAEYLKTTSSLNTLSIVAGNDERQTCTCWMVEGLLASRTVKKLELRNIQFDERSAERAARVFTENQVLQSFSLARCSWGQMHKSALYCWHASLSSNETLEELRLPMDIWSTCQWTEFIWIASRRSSLKKLTIDRCIDRKKLQSLCEVLKESGAETKASVGTDIFFFSGGNIIESAALTSVSLFCFDDQLKQLLCQLRTSNHITSVCIGVGTGDVSLSSAVAEYINVAPSLRKLRLELLTESGDLADDTNRSWKILVESLSKNVTLRELEVYVKFCPSFDEYEEPDHGIREIKDIPHELEKLAQVIKSGQRIRRVHFRAVHASHMTAFLSELGKDISTEFTLVTVTLAGSLAIESMADCFLVWETTRRNSGLVTRAAEFVSGHRLDRRYAAALEVVGCCPPLLEEFAQQQSLTVVDATPIIQRALRSIESMHDFMRLVGVVRERVVCHPRKDGRRQLDDLDDDCWRLIRRHITLFDVGTRTTHSSLMDL
ncbi:uncharacterized protein LOC142568673 isoform X1 [Dermacentor variabilis]|uniref:uncharacterized protein LOC142568673 isoform X1 n=3 Tax=Dermacentor variabilis TaxID=34621 RepID=UPI003F5C4CCB